MDFAVVLAAEAYLDARVTGAPRDPDECRAHARAVVGLLRGALADLAVKQTELAKSQRMLDLASEQLAALLVLGLPPPRHHRARARAESLNAQVRRKVEDYEQVVRVKEEEVRRSERSVARLRYDLRALLADRRAAVDERQLRLW